MNISQRFFKPNIEQLKKEKDLQGMIILIEKYAESGHDGYTYASKVQDALISSGELAASPFLVNLRIKHKPSERRLREVIDKALHTITMQFQPTPPHTFEFKLNEMDKSKLRALELLIDSSAAEAGFIQPLNTTIGSIENGFGRWLMDEEGNPHEQVMEVKCQRISTDIYTLKINRIKNTPKASILTALLLFALQNVGVQSQKP